MKWVLRKKDALGTQHSAILSFSAQTDISAVTIQIHQMRTDSKTPLTIFEPARWYVWNSITVSQLSLRILRIRRTGFSTMHTNANDLGHPGSTRQIDSRLRIGWASLLLLERKVTNGDNIDNLN
jgi:hypothetical protein